MSIRRSIFALALLPLAGIVLGGLTPATDSAMHFRLDRSAPAADSVVPPPAEVRLWFSQGAQEDATTIRVLDAGGDPLETGALSSTEDRTEHAVALPGTLPDGPYTVAWRSMAADGHVVRGDFVFTVRSQE